MPDAASDAAEVDRQAQNAHQQVDAMALVAGQMCQRLEATRQTLASLFASSEQISAVAEKTNLLALNAAIEAARAGEQGRGQ